MTGDRSKVHKLKPVVEEQIRGRVGRVDRARVAQVVRDALPPTQVIDELICQCFILLGSALSLRRAPRPDPPVVCPGFRIDRLYVCIYLKMYLSNPPLDPKTRTYYGRVGSGRTAGRRGEDGQDGTLTEQFVKETSASYSLKNQKTRGRLLRSTDKRNPMSSDGETQRSIDKQLTRDLLTERGALFVPGC